jgi:hypothetical protein
MWPLERSVYLRIAAHRPRVAPVMAAPRPPRSSFTSNCQPRCVDYERPGCKKRHCTPPHCRTPIVAVQPGVGNGDQFVDIALHDHHRNLRVLHRLQCLFAGLPERRRSCSVQLFNSSDPSPFREKDLDVEEFLVESARDLPRDAKLALLVHLDRSAELGKESEVLRAAIREFFGRRSELSQRPLRHLFGVRRLPAPLRWVPTTS